MNLFHFHKWSIWEIWEDCFLGEDLKFYQTRYCLKGRCAQIKEVTL